VNDLLKGLNAAQKQAVVYDQGPLLILAGAGSGKTRVLTHRAAWLVASGKARADELLLLTFTNKAAGEMKGRLLKLLGKKGKNASLFAGTFHSFCAYALRSQGKAIGLPSNFVIFDDGDSRILVKGILKKLDLSDKRFKVPAVKAIIEGAKNDLIDAASFGKVAYDPFRKVVARIYEEYERSLKAMDALDFSDLLFGAVKLFEEKENVLRKFQEKYKYILVDEYQDTNHSQYLLTKLLAGKYKNLTVVGDVSQCLPGRTRIKTPDGSKQIKKLSLGDLVVSAIGGGKTGNFPVKKIYKRRCSGKLVKIITKSGKKLCLTPNHLLFASLEPKDGIYWVYLMYRRDKGYRIGMTKGLRQRSSSGRQKPFAGLATRANQEAADKMWILKTLKVKEEALFWEVYFSAKYGIPTLVFDIGRRNMRIGQEQVNKLYSSIDTVKRVKKLFREEKINPDFPHHRSGGISGRRQPDRQVVHLKFFGDSRLSKQSPWGSHRIALNTTDKKLEVKVKKDGFYTRPGRQNTWRTEILRVDYKEAKNIAQQLAKAAGGIEVSHEAFLGKKNKYYFQPASHIQPEMTIAFEKSNAIIKEVVSRVDWENYKGFVYDLDIDKVHNYIAESVVVHNSIYSWRGADYRNLLSLKVDFPKLKTINLEVNYRSTQQILDVAYEVIKKNTKHPILKLKTDKKGGKKALVYQALSEGGEAAWVADKIKTLIDFEGVDPTKVAILYRTNAQSRVIEEVLIRRGLPYVLIGGVRFYERAEVKDVLSLLRVFYNSKDEVSWERLRKKMGIRRTDKVRKFIEEKGKKKWESKALLEALLEASTYLEKYDLDDEEDAKRLENIDELLSVAESFPDLGDFLENVSLVQQEYYAQEKEKKDWVNQAIRLMTLHASKGLEFEVVFIVGLEEGLLPHARSLEEEERLEEERRLCYVGMTRAMNKLFLTYARGY